MNLEEEIIDDYLNNKRLYNLQLELTNECNWRCRHCYLPEYSNYGLDTYKIKKLLQEARLLGSFEVTLTGGDIFLRKDIFEIIEFAKKLGYSVILFTNAALLNEEKIIKLSKLYVSLVSCTIFSMDSDIHDYFTQVKGSLNKTLENLLLLKKYNLNVQVKTIISNINFLEWKSIKQFCDKEGFSFAIDHDIFIKNDKNNSPADFRITPTQFMMECKKYDELRGFSAKKHDPNELACPSLSTGVFINSYGKVYPCTKFLYEIGDININSLSCIWENNENLNRVQNIRWKDLNLCNNCTLEHFCTRCPGTAFLENDSEYGCCEMSLEKAKLRRDIYELNKN